MLIGFSFLDRLLAEKSHINRNTFRSFLMVQTHSMYICTVKQFFIQVQNTLSYCSATSGTHKM